MLTLTEWSASAPITLTTAERQALENAFAATIKSCGTDDQVQVTPGSVIGTVSVGTNPITVKPKIPIDRVLFMTAFTADPFHWKDAWSSITHVDELVDGIATLFLKACRTVTARGLLRSYRQTHEDLRHIKGRVQWQTQARRHRPIPIAVAYQTHDEDIVENQIIRETLKLLRTATTPNPATALELHTMWRQFRDITPLPDPLATLERLSWTRKNEHYRPALELARIILQNRMAEIDSGGVPTLGFTLNLPAVFESFVRTCLRHYSGFSTRSFPDSWANALKLDLREAISLEPDLGLRIDGKWMFVGDVKYKRDEGSGKNADIYQLLAYATATQLNTATLIYAHGPQETRYHTVRNTNTSIKVRHLDLEKSPEEVLHQLKTVTAEDLLSSRPDTPHHNEKSGTYQRLDRSVEESHHSEHADIG